MQSTKLSDKAMLVKLTIRRAALMRRDQQVTEAIQQQYQDQSLTAITKLFRYKAGPIYQIMQKVNDVYTFHKANTLPWVDAGPRLLPAANYLDYTSEMRGRIGAVESALNHWMPQYDQLVQDDITLRNGGVLAGVSNGRAKVDDYPTAEEFRQRMSFDLRFQPMPDKKHFLFDLSEDDERAFDDQMHAAELAAKQDAIERMLQPLQHLVGKLQKPIDGEGSVFRNSALENVLEGCAEAKRLLLDDSPELKARIQELESLARSYTFGVDALRSSPATREAAAKRLADVADKMSAFF